VSSFQYDLFVIGAGSGGVRAARIAAALGAKVGLCESSRLGGTCVNLGCVPKKLMVYAADYGRHAEDAEGFGWSKSAAQFSWQTLIENKDRELARLNEVYGRILEKPGVQIHRGRGTITGPHSVEVNGETLTSQRILIATGGTPARPPIPGAHLGITSDEAFSLPKLPKSILIVGGGYIGVEFGGIFSGLGADVTMVHRRDVLLNTFDRECAAFLTNEVRKSGVTVHTKREVTAVVKRENQLEVSLSDGTTSTVDTLMWATGRRPNTAGLGLEDVGVALTPRGAVVVDDRYQTNIPSIYACGDVIDRHTLTPVALAEGMQIARNLFAGQDRAVDYTNIPTAVFSSPNLGTVGMTEEEAREKTDVVIFRSEFRPMVHTLSGRGQRVLMKLVVEKSSERVLGCHMVGPDAGEIIQGFAVALKAGATKSVFDQTIGIHPTAAEEFVTMRTPVSS